jgi:hypothetical protein
LAEEVNEHHDFVPEGVEFMYTQEAMNLYDRYERRLTKLAIRNFPDDYHEFRLNCSKMIID